MSRQITHARHDPAMALANIFQPLKRAGRPKLDIQRDFGKLTVRWRAPDAMGVSEQSVLFAIQALAGLDGAQLGPLPKGEQGKALREALQAEGRAREEFVLTLSTTWRELVLASGYSDDGGRNYAIVRDALARLAEMTVWVRDDEITSAMRLISYLRIDASHLKIALNWRLADAITGRQHARIPLDERRQLTSEPAKILHAYLAASLRPGRTVRYGVETLAGHVWDGETSGSTLRTRRQRIRAALAEIATLSTWRVNWEGELAVITHRHAQDRTNADVAPDYRRQNPGLSATR